MKRSSVRSARDVVIGVVLCALMLFPLYWMVNVSLTRPQDLLRTRPNLFPTNPTLDGYIASLGSQLPSILTSIVIGLGTALLALAISLPAAYAMSKLRAKGSGLVIFLLVLAQLIPGIVLVMALFTLYSQLGLINTYLGLILANATAAVPLAVVVLRAYMGQIPEELIEAARIDGASQVRVFFSIVIPLSRNAIVTAALFSFLFAWGDFLNARSLTSGNEILPFTLALFRFIGAETTNWNAVMASAVLASIPAMLLLILAQRYISAGLTAGAVKD
ncbi:MAG TPA: carbohydrate ABC transporter permease [Candidatus Agrococcus pullicola]|uniref:Sugar ABC transporter permease n=2 Tax=Microbacteriaceae TaxID=85023 RepID=A0A916Y043_9MICO|nr:carbohydrate ABC transporter permease [Microbacterium faecale]GGD24844.1 sugar ABC transporter permease [Microbacterium faecale]HIY64689.1 carbohydrate ABC transporter permease [Candidatus Agrococcus pullicola]